MSADDRPRLVMAGTGSKISLSTTLGKQTEGSSESLPTQNEDSESTAQSNDAAASNTISFTSDSIYHFYRNELFPAFFASLPILCYRLGHDVYSSVSSISSRVLAFLIPSMGSSSNSTSNLSLTAAPNAAMAIWNSTASSAESFIDSILQYFDADDDGHISQSEISRVRNLKLEQLEEWIRTTIPGLEDASLHPSKWSWWQQAWPMMDWKIGVFLWRSCGGLLLCILIASIVPGR